MEMAATNSEACSGGAIYWSNCDIEIADCNIADNHAYVGAGLYSIEATGKADRNASVARRRSRSS